MSTLPESDLHKLKGQDSDWKPAPSIIVTPDGKIEAVGFSDIDEAAMRLFMQVSFVAGSIYSGQHVALKAAREALESGKPTDKEHGLYLINAITTLVESALKKTTSAN